MRVSPLDSTPRNMTPSSVPRPPMNDVPRSSTAGPGGQLDPGAGRAGVRPRQPGHAHDRRQARQPPGDGVDRDRTVTTGIPAGRAASGVSPTAWTIRP
jgi:hypothetical protein